MGTIYGHYAIMEGGSFAYGHYGGKFKNSFHIMAIPYYQGLADEGDGRGPICCAVVLPTSTFCPRTPGK